MKEAADFGEKLILKFLRDRMDDINITYTRISEETGIPYTTLHRNMTGIQPFSLNNYLKVLGALKLRPYLVAAEDDDNKNFQYIHFS